MRYRECVVLAGAMAASLMVACRGAPPAEAAPARRVWSVTVLGDASDIRYAATREAVLYWNALLDSLRTGLRFGTLTVSAARVTDAEMNRLATSVRSRRVPHSRELDRIQGDVIVAFGDFDSPSVGYSPERLGRGFVALRTDAGPPMSLPNAARNIVAHELGHVLGLPHNQIAGTLMCSGPPACRPTNFQSDSVRIFPLTAGERDVLRRRWR